VGGGRRLPRAAVFQFVAVALGNIEGTEMIEGLIIGFLLGIASLNFCAWLVVRLRDAIMTKDLVK
jgi:hypothetical protein